MRSLLMIFFWVGLLTVGIAQGKSAAGMVPMDFVLMNVDSTGRICWWKTYGSKWRDHCAAAVHTRNGGFALAGTNEECKTRTGKRQPDGSTVTGKGGCWLVVTDTEGNELWDRCYYPDSAYSWCQALVQLPDGRFILAGWSGFQQYKAWLMCVSEAGDSLWSQTYAIAPNSKDPIRCTSMIACADGGCLLTGGLDQSQIHPAPDKPRAYGFILKTDTKGNQEWLQLLGGKRWNTINGIAEVPGRGYMAVGYRMLTDGLDLNYGGWLVLINSQGKVLSQNIFGEGTGIQFNSICLTTDGNFIVGGESRPTQHSDFYLIKINAAGDSLWSRSYGGPQEEGYCTAVQTSDGGYLLNGTTLPDSANQSDAFVVKTNSEGKETWAWSYGCKGTDQFRAAGSCGTAYYLAGSFFQPCADSNYTATKR